MKAVNMVKELYIFPLQLMRNGWVHQQSTFLYICKKQKPVNQSFPAEEIIDQMKTILYALLHA